MKASTAVFGFVSCFVGMSVEHYWLHARHAVMPRAVVRHDPAVVTRDAAHPFAEATFIQGPPALAVASEQPLRPVEIGDYVMIRARQDGTVIAVLDPQYEARLLADITSICQR